MAACVYCGGPVDAAHDYRKATGWVRERGATGGTNALRVREVTDEWSCRWCIDKLAAGIAVEQETML
jgi:hypothetical protein